MQVGNSENVFTIQYMCADTPPSFLMDSTLSSKVNNRRRRRRSWGALLGSHHFRVEGHVGALGWD
jgi:hypothetical protein